MTQQGFHLGGHQAWGLGPMPDQGARWAPGCNIVIDPWHERIPS